MRILVAISLSLIVLFQSAGLCLSDFFLMKDLIAHIEFHSEEYGDDFSTFFEKHYGSLKDQHNAQEKSEQEEHEKLPFQQASAHQLLIEGIVSDYTMKFGKESKICVVKPHFFYENHYSYLDSTPILQPPQYA